LKEQKERKKKKEREGKRIAHVHFCIPTPPSFYFHTHFVYWANNQKSKFFHLLTPYFFIYTPVSHQKTYPFLGSQVAHKILRNLKFEKPFWS